MTFIYETNLVIPKMFLSTKYKYSRISSSRACIRASDQGNRSKKACLCVPDWAWHEDLDISTNSPLIFASLVRYSLLHFQLSHMAVHHHLLHHLHYHRLHLLLLVQSFILNLRLGFLANHFLHRPFPFLPDWFYGFSDHLMFFFCSTAGFVYMMH